MNGLLLFLIILNAYILMVYLAARSGLLARFNIGLLGPALMIRTQRGKGIIEGISRPKALWVKTGTFGVWLTLFAMAAMTILLVWQIPTLFRIPVEQAPGARHILALPGINPLIPIGYGIVALIVSIVIHEFAHGVLARAQNLKVRSLGMLYLIVPIGAFVEPDEEELNASSRMTRMRVYAAGPTSNLWTALICGLVFSAGFMAAAEPVADGVGIMGVVPDSPADQAGLQEGWILTHINEMPITSGAHFSTSLNDTEPGQKIDVTTARHGTFSMCLAANATQVEEAGAGFDYCSLGPAPTDDGSADENNTTTAAEPSNGFLGVAPLSLPGAAVTPAELKSVLTNPFGSLYNFIVYIALPFFFLSPINDPVTAMYDVPWEGAGETVFWVTANLFYWVMWISLMLGLTNALPAVPLDGGALFRDAVTGVLERLNKTFGRRRPAADPMALESTERNVRGIETPEKREAFAKRASVVVSLSILALILLQFLAPRLAAAFA